MKRLLLVEDEQIMAKNIAFFLTREGFQVDTAYDGEAALELFAVGQYDLVLLDWTLPKLDGLEVCKRIRRESQVPIMMLTAKGEIFDKVVGLEVGADDYLVKPFDQRELLARIHALLRRISAEHKGQAAEAWLQYEDLRLDREKLLLVCGEETAALTANEYKLLELMMKKPHNVFTREYLYEEVWGELPGYNDRTVDVTISRLRRKILQLCGKKYFQAVRGLGYRFGEKS
ncbi:MAG TPA: DNA-binding response regulator [Firmicutes bacterium]|jgi:DNA-binding response OmpR family regulator|nr:response regulator transcription factor [Bacillota bacterium]HAA38435.1 DNA-binding response regulator [Bacillota bacterium]